MFLKILKYKILISKILRITRTFFSKLYIQSTLNFDIILWHLQLIVGAEKC